MADEKPDEQNADEAAEQPELLGENRKDEVGGALRHKTELALQAVQPTLAEQAPRPNRDSSLHKVVARTQRVQVRVEEDLQAPSLVAVQQVRKQRERHATRKDQRKELPRAGAGEKQHAEQHAEEHYRRAQVWLREDETSRRRDQKERTPECPPRQPLRAAEVGGEYDDEQELGELGRFEREPRHRKPPPRTQCGVARQVYGQEDEDHPGVEAKRKRPQAAVVE